MCVAARRARGWGGAPTRRRVHCTRLDSTHTGCTRCTALRCAALRGTALHTRFACPVPAWVQHLVHLHLAVVVLVHVAGAESWSGRGRGRGRSFPVPGRLPSSAHGHVLLPVSSRSVIVIIALALASPRLATARPGFVDRAITIATTTAQPHLYVMLPQVPRPPSIGPARGLLPSPSSSVPLRPSLPVESKVQKKKKLKKFWPVAFPSDPEFNCQVPGHCARCDWLACSARLLAARLLLPHIPRPVYVHVHATTCPPSIPALQALPSSPVGITVQHGMQLCNLTRWIQMARAGPLSLLRRYYFNTLYSWLVLSPPTITIHTRYRDFFPKQKKMAGGSLGLSVNPQRLR